MPEDWFLQWTFSDEVERTHTDDYKDPEEAAAQRARYPGTRRAGARTGGVVLPAAARLAGEQVLVAGTLRVVDAPVPRRPAARASRAGQRAHLHDRRRPRDHRRLVLQPPVARARVHADAGRRHHPQRPHRLHRDAGVGERPAPLLRRGRRRTSCSRSARSWRCRRRRDGRRRTPSTSCSDCRVRAPPPGSPPRPTPTFRPLVEFSYQVEGPCHRVLVVDGRTKRRFPFRTSQAGGIDYEGGNALLPDDVHPTGLPGEQSFGLFGDSPMAAALPPRPMADTKITLVVLAVPALGPEGMELALVPLQRLARLLTQVDAESWAYERRHVRGLAGLARALRVGGPAVGRHPCRLHRLRRLLVGAGRDSPCARRASSSWCRAA